MIRFYILSIFKETPVIKEVIANAFLIDLFLNLEIEKVVTTNSQAICILADPQWKLSNLTIMIMSLTKTRESLYWNDLTFTVDWKDSFNIGEAFNKKGLGVLFKFAMTLHKNFSKGSVAIFVAQGWGRAALRVRSTMNL